MLTCRGLMVCGIPLKARPSPNVKGPPQ